MFILPNWFWDYIIIILYVTMEQVVASVPYEWSRSQLLVFASLRALLVPLLVLCATPRGDPIIPGEGYPLLFSLLLGLTNGLVGSVPMIQAPSRVSEEHRELTGYYYLPTILVNSKQELLLNLYLLTTGYSWIHLSSFSAST